MPDSQKRRPRRIDCAPGLGRGHSTARLAQSATDDPQTDVGNDSTSNGSYFGGAEWMRIPGIGIDAHISDVTITGGYHDVPWFDVGHYVDSHHPGEPGNSIFNGHVTIEAGQVFRHLDQLVEGDAVFVYTPAYRLDWVVTDMFSVSAEDSTFLQDTDEARMTLYTCGGQFNPIERSYAQRLLVLGELDNVVHRT
jgi:LPXTG-site transpeptidase (sortase) family protein